MLKLILDVRVANTPDENDGSEDKNAEEFEQNGLRLKDGWKILNHSFILSVNGDTRKSQKKVINCEKYSG